MRADAQRYFAERGGPVVRLLRRRPSTVEAVQVMVGFEQHAADFCSGVPVWGRGVVVWLANGDLAHADYGDWIVRGPFGTYDVVLDRSIFSEYEGIIPAVTE